VTTPMESHSTWDSNDESHSSWDSHDEYESHGWEIWLSLRDESQCWEIWPSVECLRVSGPGSAGHEVKCGNLAK
jgi:hypothetical protein